MSGLVIASLPEKVQYERRTCEAAPSGDRCRKRATVWMDGVTACDEHARLWPAMLHRYAHRIRYELDR